MEVFFGHFSFFLCCWTKPLMDWTVNELVCCGFSCVEHSCVVGMCILWTVSGRCPTPPTPTHTFHWLSWLSCSHTDGVCVSSLSCHCVTSFVLTGCKIIVSCLELIDGTESCMKHEWNGTDVLSRVNCFHCLSLEVKLLTNCYFFIESYIKIRMCSLGLSGPRWMNLVFV